MLIVKFLGFLLAICYDLADPLFLFIILRTVRLVVGHCNIIVRVDDFHLGLGLGSLTLMVGGKILDFVREFLKHAFGEHLIVREN